MSQKWANNIEKSICWRTGYVCIFVLGIFVGEVGRIVGEVGRVVGEMRELNLLEQKWVLLSETWVKKLLSEMWV